MVGWWWSYKTTWYNGSSWLAQLQYLSGDMHEAIEVIMHISCSRYPDVLFSEFGFIFLSYFIISTTYLLSVFLVYSISRSRTSVYNGQRALTSSICSSCICWLLRIVRFSRTMRMASWSGVRKFVFRTPPRCLRIVNCWHHIGPLNC